MKPNQLMINTWTKLISISLLIITIYSVLPWCSIPYVSSTILWWVVQICILYFLVKSKKYFYKESEQSIFVLKIYLWWIIICLIRGIIISENYWDWKQLLSNGMVLLLPLTIYIGTNKELIQKIISLWIKIAFPLFFLFLPLLKGEAYGRWLFPLSFLLLFFPILKINWKVPILLTISFVFIDLDARSNVIKFVVPLAISFIYYFRFSFIVKWLEGFRRIFLITPFILFILAFFGVFNIFKMDEYIGDLQTNTIVDGEKTQVSLTTDTRTFLYEEVLYSAVKNNYIIFGRTPARGNESDFFGDDINQDLKTGRKERNDNEVAILNIFNWTGALGVLLYFILFYWASYLSINKSKNIFIKMIGLYVSFRWIYGWVEDFHRFDLSTIYLWFMICMCMSGTFRNMTNSEMKIWVYGIFNKRYRVIEKIRDLKKEEWKRLSE